jgi:hypothetical protein
MEIAIIAAFQYFNIFTALVFNFLDFIQVIIQYLYQIDIGFPVFLSGYIESEIAFQLFAIHYFPELR